MRRGSMLGKELPQHFRVRYILIIANVIGILCTYAEPAIASLRPLAELVFEPLCWNSAPRSRLSPRSGLCRSDSP